MIGRSKVTANFCANSVSLGSFRHRTDCLRIPIPDRLRAPVLCLLVLCSRAEYLRILCGQCFLRYCKSLISARESFHDALLTRAIPGDVRVPIHSHRTIDRSLHAQRRLRVTHQPACHRDPGLLLRCCGSLQPDPTLLEILVNRFKSLAETPQSTNAARQQVLLPRPIQLPHVQPHGVHDLGQAR
jgi:hypothetical protein